AGHCGGKVVLGGGWGWCGEGEGGATPNRLAAESPLAVSALRGLTQSMFKASLDRTIVARICSASEVPSASPFSKSSPIRPIVLVTCARQSTRAPVLLAKA